MLIKRSKNNKDSELFTSNNVKNIWNRDKRLSYVGSNSDLQNKLGEATHNFIKDRVNYNYDEDWKTQTYEKIPTIPKGFEPIIEKPYDETYGTTSHKKHRRRKNRNFDKFYNKEMNFVQEKYNNINNELLKREANEFEQFTNHRESSHLMSDGSRKILHNKLKSTIINTDPNKALKLSKLFDTPVHERLFIDNMQRK